MSRALTPLRCWHGGCYVLEVGRAARTPTSISWQHGWSIAS